MTPKTNTKSTAAGKFEKKLLRYALAGTTVLGLPIASQANVFTPGVTPNGTSVTANGNSATLNISFDNLAVADFTIEASTLLFGASASVYGPATTSFLGPAGGQGILNLGYPTAFASVSSLTAGTVTGQPSNKLSDAYFSKGSFPTSGSAILGVIFQIGSQNYLGYADLAIQEVADSSSTVTLLDSGYTQMSTTTPEPTSFLPLYALGAAGLAIARKRRSAASPVAN